MHALAIYLGGLFPNLSPFFRSLHERGRDDLTPSIYVGMCIGALCSLPAVLVGRCKSIPLYPVFWGVTLAAGSGQYFEVDDSGGVAFGILAGIVALVYVLVKPDPRKVVANPDAYRFPVFPPLLSAVACLLVLPGFFTTTVVTQLPDTRSWLEKLRGDPVPSRVDDVTNWGMVLIVTLVVTVFMFFLARGDHETNSDSINSNHPPM